MLYPGTAVKADFEKKHSGRSTAEFQSERSMAGEIPWIIVLSSRTFIIDDP